MSIKIYNGYILRKKMTLMEANNLMNTLREKYQEKILPFYKQMYFENLYFYADLYAIDPEACKKLLKENEIELLIEKDTFLKTLATNLAWSQSHKVAKASESGEFNRYNLATQLQLLPLPDKLLILSFGNSEVDDLIQDIYASLGIEDYHYQNQTDKPEKISKEEWEMRYQDWKTAMPTWIPEEFGFSVKLFSENWLPMSAKGMIKTSSYEDYKKPLESRCSRLVRYLIPYPEFNGSNYGVFLTKEFSKWEKEQAKQLEERLKKAGDPVEKIFKEGKDYGNV